MSKTNAMFMDEQERELEEAVALETEKLAKQRDELLDQLEAVSIWAKTCGSKCKMGEMDKRLFQSVNSTINSVRGQ